MKNEKMKIKAYKLAIEVLKFEGDRSNVFEDVHKLADRYYKKFVKAKRVEG